SYKAHSGVAVDPYGVYLVRLDTAPKGNTVLISNAYDLGDTKVAATTCRLETDLLYPVVRGKDIARWNHKTELFVVVANRSPRKEDQISESDMRRLHP